MRRRSVLIVQLTFYLILLSATVHGQAVVPNPADIAPVINPPNPQTNIVLSLADFMGGGVSTYQAFKNALAACQQRHAAKLLIPTGRYVFDDPQILQTTVHLDLAGQSDLTVDGQGAELVFHYPTMGIHFDVSRRVVVRNLFIDYDFQIASVGVAKKESDGTTSIHILDNYQINENTFIHIIAPYDITNLRWRAYPGEIYNVQGLTLIRPQTVVSPAFSPLTDGEEVVLEYYGNQGNALAVFNSFPETGPTSDISLENITVYGAPGFGFFVNGGRGFRLSACRIMQRPGTNRPVSTASDGAHFGNTLGDILIEDCDFSGQGDDSLNIHANWLRVAQQINARTVVLAYPYAGLVGPGAVLRFVRPDTFAEYARRNVIQVTFDQSTGRYTVTVDQDLPANLVVNDQVINLTQSNHRFLIRRNYFHDHRATGMKIQSQDGVVENNRVKDTTWQSMLLFADTAFFGEGPGAENVIVRNNTFDGCSYGNYGSVGGDMGSVNITVDVTPHSISSGAVIKNILFEGNTISRAPYLALFVSSASGITVSNNVIINSNTLGAFPPWYGSNINVIPHGSIMVTKASNVLLTGNLQLATPQQTERGVFIDPQTTTGVTSQGYYVDPLPPNVIDDSRFYVRQHYLDFLSRFPDLSGWDFWTNEITSCGTNQQCIEAKRINVSAAYFLSIEFQQTGYLVERIYKAAYGDGSGASTFPSAHQLAVPIVRFNEFLPDTQRIGGGVVVGTTGWETVLENNKQAFASEFVQRSRFTSALPTTMTPAQFVDKLFLNAGVTPSASDRQAAINEFGSATNTSDVAARARALRKVAENPTLLTNEFNRAFVLMQFFGYLRRNPNDPQDTDYTGYDFWLTKLNQFNGNYNAAEMVKAFITSTEYRQRFGP